MENEIRQILQEANILKSNGKSSKEIAEFVHIELGKLIIYDNNYSIGFEYDLSKNLESGKTSASKIRQQNILSEKSNIESRNQVCKGMAEIYTAILTELGIDAKVVAVQSKEEVEGEERDDGSIIDVPGIYSANFDSNLKIQLGENEKSNDNPIGHYYTIIKLDEGEFIQDFLTETALTRIKIGEAQTSDEIPGFHRKEEHRKRTNAKNSRISEIYLKRIREELYEYMQGKDDSKVFDFLFEKLNEHINEFGFEEAKDFVMMYAQSVIPREMMKKAPIPVNLVKEDEENCEVLCVYRYGDKNYLLRGGQTIINLPIGEVSNSEIQKVILQGFVPRKLNDAKIVQKIEIESIIENNRIINEQIQQIVELRRSGRTPFEQNGDMDALIQSIFEKETKKCLELYKIEFLGYRCQGKDGFSLKRASRGADCSGGINGLQVTLDMQKFIDKEIMPFIQKMGYSINEEGIAYFNSDENDYNAHASNIKMPQQYVGSTRDQLDYFAELFAKNGIDMDWVLDALPHEAIHTFGTIGGNTFLKEGITEELAREIGEKYGIRLSPTSHTQEAEFVRKLEIIVGRDNVIYSGMWSGKFKEKEFKKILEKNPELKYEELSEIFELLKYEPSKLNKVEELKNKLLKFSENYPDVTEILKDKVKLYGEQDLTTRYEGIAKEFDEKLGLKEGTFYNYAELLDCLYSLNLNHKKNPDFYRLVYSLNIEELKEKVQSIYEKDLKKVEKTDIEKIEKLKETLESDMKIIKEIEKLYKQISQDNNLNINGFQDLMNPINEYVKGRDLNFDEQPKDYSEVLKIQREEIAMFEAMKVSMFHDQKSEGAFRVIETGVHTIPSQDIKRVAKKDEVVAEKENAIQIRIKEEKDREDELEQDNQTI